MAAVTPKWLVLYRTALRTKPDETLQQLINQLDTPESQQQHGAILDEMQRRFEGGEQETRAPRRAKKE